VSTACVRTVVAHIFRPVSACPLRSPICVHATVQSAAIKSDSSRQNICKTLSRFLLAFIRSLRRDATRRRQPLSRCSYLRAARPISAKYKCVIKREHIRYQSRINVLLRELVREERVSVIALPLPCVTAIMHRGGNLIRYLFPNGRAISYRAHDRFGGMDYAKSNFCI